MYAILQQSGHQYRVSPGDRLLVDRLAAEVGSVVALEPVVLVQGDKGVQVGTPVVDGARVAAVVVGHTKGGKIRVFKYKPKKRYRRTHGHRSLLTELRIEAVLAKGEKLPEAPKAEAKAAKAKAPAAKAAKAPKATAAAAEVETPAAEAPVVETPAAEAPTAKTAKSAKAPATKAAKPATAKAAKAPEPPAEDAPKKRTTRAKKPADGEQTES